MEPANCSARTTTGRPRRSSRSSRPGSHHRRTGGGDGGDVNPGAYTAVVSGKDSSTGIGVVELYNLGTASVDTSSSAKLANISTRGFVQRDDDVMIGGFIVSGGSSRVIVRTVGPSLGKAGVNGALEDTTLDFVDGSGSLIAANDDWRTGGQEQQIIDSTVPPGDNRESAVVATLNPAVTPLSCEGKMARWASAWSRSTCCSSAPAAVFSTRARDASSGSPDVALARVAIGSTAAAGHSPDAPL